MGGMGFTVLRTDAGRGQVVSFDQAMVGKVDKNGDKWNLFLFLRDYYHLF
jgi:hypothetical protein